MERIRTSDSLTLLSEYVILIDKSAAAGTGRQQAEAKTYFAEFPALSDSAAIENRIHEVSEARRERIRTAKRPETQASLLAAGLILNAVMKKEFGLSEFKIEIGEHGKPYLADHKEIHFNLSHSAAVVACTVSDVECGVDVEKIEASHNMMGCQPVLFPARI